MKDLFKDNKKLISYYFYRKSVPYGKNCVTEKNKKVKKEILAFLMPNCPWRQVVSINRWRQDVLCVKMSGVVGRFKMSHTQKQIMQLCVMHLTDFDCNNHFKP